jgi:hypothetical protein
MTTRREQILSAITTALAGTTGVGSRIYRSRVEAFSRGESPAISLEPINDTPATNTSLPTLDWSLTVRIAVIVRGAIPDQLADPIVESLHSLVMADLSLGGLAMDIIPASVDWQLIEADQPAGVVLCDYVVRYRTSVGSLSA